MNFMQSLPERPRSRLDSTKNLDNEKYEEVYRTEYRDFQDALRQIGRFIESVYNRQRLHSALGYRPPVEFEQSLPLQMELSGSQA